MSDGQCAGSGRTTPLGFLFGISGIRHVQTVPSNRPYFSTRLAADYWGLLIRFSLLKPLSKRLDAPAVWFLAEAGHHHEKGPLASKPKINPNSTCFNSICLAGSSILSLQQERIFYLARPWHSRVPLRLGADFACGLASKSPLNIGQWLTLHGVMGQIISLLAYNLADLPGCYARPKMLALQLPSGPLLWQTDSQIQS